MPKRVEHRREHHGDVFIDPYEWLRDKSDPAVIEHLEAENAYTEQVTDHLAPLRQKIFDEIKARTKETDLSVPTRRGDWWYYCRSFEGKQYSVHCRCPITDPDDWTPPALDEHTEIPGEQVLLDENVEARARLLRAGRRHGQHRRQHVGLLGRRRGDERYTLRFKDLRTGELYDDEIVGIGAGATWAADNRTIYYTTVDDAWRPDTVWRHRIGAGLPAEKVYHEPDEKFWLAVGRTRSDKYVIIAAGSAVTSEIRYADATDRQAEFVPVWPRRELVEYSVEHAVVGGEDRFLILHNDGAENFTLVDAPVSDPTATRTLIEHRDDVRLDAVDAFVGHLVVSYRSEALPRIQLWPLYADGNYGRPEDFTFESELMSAGLAETPTGTRPSCGSARRRSSPRCASTTSTSPRASGRCCANSRCSATTGPRTTSSAATGQSPPTAHGCRSRSSTAPACSSRHPRCCTATAPTSRARTPGSLSRGCPCWTAAWCSSSRMCAGAASWAARGTSTASCSRRRTPSPTSSPSRVISSTPM